MPELGVHCQAIIESRHVDVIEMDAASHTGIDDVREIIENARYRPVSARTKVYIIDEVHMLSKAAFNGLLKTLEEPPEHVKFLFATTEIDKVPVTVRSRCLRFDLKRIDAELLAAHLDKICRLEDVKAEPDALALIARVAEGSVRDSLSLLDQAIAHGGAAGVRVVDLRGMLGPFRSRRHRRTVRARDARRDRRRRWRSTQRLYRAGADPARDAAGAQRILPFRHAGRRSARGRARGSRRFRSRARRAAPEIAEDSVDGRAHPRLDAHHERL